MTINSFIHLRDLEFDVRLGWTENERTSFQKIKVEIKIIFATAPAACQTELLEDTLCYAQVIEKIQQELSKKEFKLIEHLSYSLYELIKKTYTDIQLFTGVRVTKKIPIDDVTGHASFSYADTECAWSF